MYIAESQIGRSTTDRTKIGIETRITYEDGKDESLWVDVPEEKERYISDSANPWLVMLLSVAITLNEQIETEVPANRKLIENLQALQRIWCIWYKDLTPIAIKSPIKKFYSHETFYKKSASCFGQS